MLNLIGKTFGRLTVMNRIPCSSVKRRVTWICQCECGGTATCSTGNLRSGTSQSCGCLQRERASAASRKPGTAFRKLFATYQGHAKRRGLVFNVGQSIFWALVVSPCHYCGREPEKVFKSYAGEEFLYNGIDRVDNKRGYELYNCVPCCWWCNELKRDRDAHEFLDIVFRIASNLGPALDEYRRKNGH